MSCRCSTLYNWSGSWSSATMWVDEWHLHWPEPYLSECKLLFWVPPSILVLGTRILLPEAQRKCCYQNFHPLAQADQIIGNDRKIVRYALDFNRTTMGLARNDLGNGERVAPFSARMSPQCRPLSVRTDRISSTDQDKPWEARIAAPFDASLPLTRFLCSQLRAWRSALPSPSFCPRTSSRSRAPSRCFAHPCPAMIANKASPSPFTCSSVS